MLHHTRGFTNAVQADRHAAAARRRPPVDPGDFERFMQRTAGPGEELSAVVHRVSARLRAMARAHRLPAHHADDVVQSTWLRLLEHHDRIRAPEATEAWMRTTARRESLRILRESNRTQPVEPELLDRAAAPADHGRADPAEREAVLADAIDALPRHQRELMRMLLADPPQRYADIAAALQIPIGSIGPTRARALARLRRDPRVMSLDPAEVWE